VVIMTVLILGMFVATADILLVRIIAMLTRGA